jgi:hypothetical protein
MNRDSIVAISWSCAPSDLTSSRTEYPRGRESLVTRERLVATGKQETSDA